MVAPGTFKGSGRVAVPTGCALLQGRKLLYVQAGELRYLSFRHPGRKQLPGDRQLPFGKPGGTACLAPFRKPGIVSLLPRRGCSLAVASMF